MNSRAAGPQNWRRLSSDRFGMMNVFDRAMADLDSFLPPRLPAMQGPGRLVLASDYSGQHRGALYQTYSFLLVSQDTIGAWLARRSEIRQRWLRDGRRLSYKTLSESLRWHALEPFLDAAHLLTGVLATIAISNRMRSLFTSDGDILHTSTKLAEYQYWQPRPFERLYRVCSFAAFLLAGLSFPGQALYWVTDDDEIVATAKHQEAFSRMFTYACQFYVPHGLSSVSLSTTGEDSGDRSLEDLASMPDLAAGAVAAFLEAAPESKDMTHLELPLPENLPGKAYPICKWLSIVDRPLKKVVLVVDPMPSPGEYQVRSVQFIPQPSPLP